MDGGDATASSSPVDTPSLVGDAPGDLKAHSSSALPWAHPINHHQQVVLAAIATTELAGGH